MYMIFFEGKLEDTSSIGRMGLTLTRSGTSVPADMRPRVSTNSCLSYIRARKKIGPGLWRSIYLSVPLYGQRPQGWSTFHFAITFARELHLP